ncbi:uncharacterized protein MYCGRDRAFT_106799 [Zymoseptoria tritici IPO323]|uniref:Fe2OG dioxygenase domain-containing protein n=1 Tax=Zymoseptoria tritici (strain CBS 115943 / IPO323) TaxID=336722 RepID=F9WYQ0_ZYMTI|nr:uncharacterized protein MYCGRDRAFT_106799 [Zymoseptoria tritici IPO323]EGP90888.1 hypothetical protein MYCGRDRAFT_106799 [Zymoseptoria tritici IPO323]
MASLFALLSQNNRNLQTRKGLILLGLQNDFISPDGKLPVPDTDFLKSITELVPAFREFGDVIWVRSEFATTRPVHAADTNGDVVIAGGSSGMDPALEYSDDEETAVQSDLKTRKTAHSPTNTEVKDEEDDEELFLSRTTTREPCCIRGSRGAEYCDEVKALIKKGKDLEVTKSHYSAFGSTSLLMTLRSKLITELYVCGCITNLSVYASAMDAARYGIKITLIDDCLGYRKQDRHDSAVKQLKDFMEARTMRWQTVLDRLRNPSDDADGSEYSYEEASEASDDMEQMPTAGPRPGEMTALEADSEDSDEEVQPSISPLVHRHSLELRYLSKNSGSHLIPAAGRPRKSLDEPSQLSSSRRTSTAKESRNGQGAENRKSNRPSVTSTGKLRAHDSPRHKKQPGPNLKPQATLNTQSAYDTAPKSSGLKKRPDLAALPAVANLSPSDITGYGTMAQAAETQEESSPPLAHTRATKDRPLLGDDMERESAGSRIRYDLLPEHISRIMFHELEREVDWQKMYHQAGEVPRLVCCQGSVGNDGSMPVYRHPSDQSVPLQPWTTNVDLVRKAAEKIVGHPLNHVLIQLYRNGNDYISEHSDKTLDVAPRSNIVNVSFGAQRTMRLRTKRRALTSEPKPPERSTYRIPMPHNSMLTMSLATNAQYLHGIKADKRPRCELVEEEKAYNGQRISLTFRHIATFINEDSSRIWGQGAIGKTRKTARSVINGDPAESERMVRAFAAENQASSIRWEGTYGDGFDVLHLKSAG